MSLSRGARVYVLLGLFTPPVFAGDCVKTGQTCVAGPATRLIAGYPVTRACWQLTDTYDCVSATTTTDCQAEIAAGCTQVDSTCVETGARGACLLAQQIWQCPLAPAAPTVVTHCGQPQYCLGGHCFNTASTPDPDFARAVTGLETQREAGKYLDPARLVVFQGTADRCQKKLFGLVNCCKGNGGGSAFSNFSLIEGAGGQALDVVGSRYTYDALFDGGAPGFILNGFESLFGAGGGSSALAGFMAGDVSIDSFLTSLVPGPWSMAMLAIELSGLLSCEKSAQSLALKNDQQLCHVVGSHCSVKLPLLGVCAEVTETFCCFNSRLSRMLNEQGRAQLGRGWGSTMAPDCNGFTLTQLQSIDFSKLDFSDFYPEITPILPNPTPLQQRAQQQVQHVIAP